MQQTNIAWADLTWNCVRGCSRISPGCTNCYAEMIAVRFSRPGNFGHGFAEFRIIGRKREAHWTGKVELIEEKLREPIQKRKWALKFAEQYGRKPRCFANSMSDLFHESLPTSDICYVLAAMAACPEINFLVLTKRAERMKDICVALRAAGQKIPPDNIWLGVSVEDQKRKDRIDHLRNTPAAVRFISFEPLLEDLGEVNLAGISMAITGGESGPNARPFNLTWARSLRDQCRAASVAFFMKQYGSKPFETDLMHSIKSDQVVNIGCMSQPHLQGFTTIVSDSGIEIRKNIRLKARNGDEPSQWAAEDRVQEFPL